MFVIDKRNRITLTRSDTATMLISVFDLDGIEYEIKDTDVVTFTIRKTDTSEIVFQTTADDRHFVTIYPENTAQLECGTYIYDVQIKTGDGYNYTIIPQNYFNLTEEVTY